MNENKGKWINIKDELPAHQEAVLVATPKGCAVCWFLINKKANDLIRENGHFVPEKDDEGFSFCSRENVGMVLHSATHWQQLPILPYEMQ